MPDRPVSVTGRARSQHKLRLPSAPGRDSRQRRPARQMSGSHQPEL